MEPAIEYAPAEPWHRRPKIRRRAVLFLSLVLLGLAAWMIGPRVVRRFEFVYWQNKCMAYTIPPGTVVEDYAGTTRGTVREIEALAGTLPGLRHDLASMSERTLFMHERGAGADRRLVVVRLVIAHQHFLEIASGSEIWTEVFIESVVMAPGNFVEDPYIVRTGRVFNFKIPTTATSSSGPVFYGGAPDPSDPYAFEIPCDVGARRVLKFRLVGDDAILTSK